MSYVVTNDSAAEEFFIADDDSSHVDSDFPDLDPHDAAPITDHPRPAEVDRTSRLITPTQAEQLRLQLGEEHRAALRERRVHTRALAANQIRQGTRPRRPKRINSVELISLNVSCASRLKMEGESGDLFKGIDGAFVQEHREHGDGKDNLISWLRRHGWDPIAEDAYWKHSGYGGGPLIMTNNLGLRPLPHPPDPHVGRVCWGEMDINGCITTGSVYAISGQGIGKQIPLLSHIAQRVIAGGLPCILAGDWQMSPDELRKSDFIRIIDAEVVATGHPTNVISGSELDYFVVSRSLLGGASCASIDPSGSFSPHVAVRLSLPIERIARSHRRLRVPRLLPIDLPIGPLQVPQYRIDWHGWLRDDADGDVPSLSTLAEEWYAGAEVELVERHALDMRDAAAFSGIGKAGVVVQADRECRFRNVADEL